MASVDGTARSGLDPRPLPSRGARLRICLLFDVDEGVLSDRGGVDLPGGPHTRLPEHDWTLVPLAWEGAADRVRALAGEEFDVFFNLCDGAADEERAGIEVVETLESLGVPFTGATASFYEPSRDEMKAACARAGVGAPAHVVVDGLDGLEAATAALAWPRIVKHPSSYSSIGLTPDSVVEGPAEQAREARRAVDEFGAALVEEFVAGREFTVLVAENPDDPDDPIVYDPVEFRFPEGETFKHWQLKWYGWKGMTAEPVEDPALRARLRAESGRFFAAIGGTGYGRCDVRVDPDGRPMFLEINPNCGVYYPDDEPGSADLILLHDPAGHAGFTRRVLEAALARRRRTAGGGSPARATAGATRKAPRT